MSTSLNSIDHDQSIDLDEIEQLISDDMSPKDDDRTRINTESRIIIQSLRSSNDRFESQFSHSSSNSTRQVQNVSLSLEKSLATSNDDQSTSIITILKAKTSNIPGPVGLLPILKTTDDLKRLKEDKSARDTLTVNETNINVKRTKRSSDLFSLNIDNYPSHALALKQLQDSFSCEPISIHTALIKARLGIKKRIPLMCAAVTHYDRQENTILLDRSGHIRATFIGDDESLDNYNIRVGHTLVLRNVAVFTSTRHRHHYVNIHLQNIIAIQDPLCDAFSMPSMSQEQQRQKSMLGAIEHEISAYEDTSRVHNETFHIFSQFELNDDEQPPLKKMNTNSKSSNNAAFNHINSNGKSPPASSMGHKFKVTTNPPARSAVHQQKQSIPVIPTCPPLHSHLSSSATVTPPSSIVEVDLLQMINKPIDADLNGDAMNHQISDIDNDEFFTTW